MKMPTTRADVPATWALQVSNVIARGEAKGLISEAQSEAFLEMLANASVRADHATFNAAPNDTLQLARRYNLSSYDASYLELALRSAAPLASLDGDLNKAARRAGVARFAG
jgi:predicted nucleic acid-binding protein